MQTKREIESIVKGQRDFASYLRSLAGKRVDAFVEKLLRSASRSKPLTNERIRFEVSRTLGLELSERDVKEVILKLRNRRVAILASKTKPFGYWLCRSRSEMEAHIRRVRREAVGMLATLKAVVDANFPELTGQLTFGFDSEVQSYGRNQVR